MSKIAIDEQQLGVFAKAIFCHASDGVNISIRTFPDDNRPNAPAISIKSVKINGEGVEPVIRLAVSEAFHAANRSDRVVFAPIIAGLGDRKAVNKKGEVLDYISGAEDNVSEAYTITVECDAQPTQARATLEGLLGPATMVVGSGGEWTNPDTGEIEPKLHLHWRLKEPATGTQLADLKQARGLAARLAGSDPSGVPVVHPMRWPGSVHRKGAPRLAKIVECNSGCELDLKDALGKLRDALEKHKAEDPKSSSADGSTASGATPGGDGDPRTDPELIQLIMTGEQYHPALTPLAARLVGRGMYTGAVVNMLYGLIDAAPRHDLRWLARRAEIPRIVDTAVAKYEGRNEANQGQITATPFLWTDPTRIPPREFVYGKHYIRQFVGTTVAPGGVGKSSLGIAESLSMASGKSLLDVLPKHRLRVWYWNGEDPVEELQRRLMATAIHYGLNDQDIDGWLFINSGRRMPIVIAEQTRDGARIATPIVDAVIKTIKDNKIDVVIIDPFVSSHRVSENDNNSIERVAKTWASIADQTSAAIDLVHHSRKTGGAEVTVEDGRGASALLSAARSARVLNGMTQDEAEKAGIDKRRLHFRVDNGKANLAPPVDGADWFQLTSVALGNGDDVGVVRRWEWPNPFDGISVADLRAAQNAVAAAGPWRESVQASDWVGKPIARALKLDPTNKADSRKITALLKIWITNKMFVRVERKDPKRRDIRTFIEVGTWATD